MHFRKEALFPGSATDYKWLKEQGALIVDVRSKQEFNQGHYRKALNIPLDQIGREIPKLKKKNKVIITCCLSGARSGAAKRQLEAAGIVGPFEGSKARQVLIKSEMELDSIISRYKNNTLEPIPIQNYVFNGFSKIDGNASKRIRDIIIGNEL